ncbi:MAG: hypothetical protein C0485_05305 [Pirellula sp.]|nr:hypothetical protein [Pirellula sp.]
MSQFTLFTKFLEDRNIASEDLAEYQNLVEPAESEGWQGYRIQRVGPTNRITQRCQVLMQYAWHCRDYVKKILEEHGVENVGRVVNGYIEKSRAIQILSYLAHQYKHGGVDHDPKWAGDLEPRILKPFVRGQLREFPLRLKPTVMRWGDNIGEFEFVGHCSIGDVDYPFKDFTWEFSCTIVDKDGRELGHAAELCERAFETWFKILEDHGIQIAATAIDPLSSV